MVSASCLVRALLFALAVLVHAPWSPARPARVCGPGLRRVGDASRFMRFEMVLRGSRDMVCMCDVVAGRSSDPPQLATVQGALSYYREVRGHSSLEIKSYKVLKVAFSAQL